MREARQLHTSIGSRWSPGKLLFLALSVGVAISAAACGQVVTPEPSATPREIETSTPLPSRSPFYAPTAGVSNPLPRTLTPSVTPTPIVHVVQKGDTLQAIAFEFGVSVQALQKANGIENPQFLQVGEELVIPRNEEARDAATGLLLPTPTPHPIQAQGVAFYESPVGSLLALGEVANTTAITLTNVQVDVKLLGANGNALAKVDTFVSMDVMPPGTRSPFDILFNAPPTDWISYQVTVIRAQEVGALAAAYVPMTLVNAQGRMSGPQFEVTGTVKNASSQRVARYVEIHVTTYDAEGTVTGFRRVALRQSGNEDGLMPGKEMPFTLSLATHEGPPSDFAVTAMGHTDIATRGG